MTILKKYSWKILGVILMLYVLVAGFLIPLRSGIYAFSPNRLFAGEISEVDITGYNTHFSYPDTKAWLRLPGDSLLEAVSLEVVDDVRMKARFSIPGDITAGEKFLMASLIVDNAEDGYAVYPQGIRITAPVDASSVSVSADVPLSGIEVIRESNRFVFPFRNILYETIRNTFFHVAIWFAMFLLLIYSCYCSIRYLVGKNYEYDMKSSALTSVALWFGIAGLLTGSMWAKFTWGTFWTSDIKLNMSAIALLVYFAYWILRKSITDVDAKARIAAIYNLFAFVCLMVLVMVIPRLTDSLHPGNGGNPALGGEDLDNTLRAVFYPAIIGYTLIGLWMAELHYRYSRIYNKWLLAE